MKDAWGKEMTVRPFSNGTQYMDWEASNCARCKKAATQEQLEAGDIPCDIQKELAYGACGDGTISDEIAKRMGRSEGRYVWMCKEVKWTEEWKREVTLRKIPK